MADADTLSQNELAIRKQTDAEAAALAIALYEPEFVDNFFAEAKEHYFTRTDYRQLFRKMQQLYSENRYSYTELELALAEEQREKLLHNMSDKYTAPEDLPQIIRRLQEAYKTRRIVAACNKIRTELMAPDSSVKDAAEYAMHHLMNAIKVEETAMPQPVEHYVQESYRRVLMRQEGDSDEAIPCGYVDLNTVLKGYRRQNLYILGGRPGMGKTAFALNTAVNVASQGKPVLMFSLEMAGYQLTDRLLMNLSGIDSEHFYDRMEADTMDVLNENLSILCDRCRNNLHIMDRRGLTVEQICAYSRMHHRQKGDLGLLVIDFLTIIQPDIAGGSANKNMALIIGDIVRKLRDLGQELDCAILLLAQLNRGLERRDEKRPRLSDLRESGNIEEFADVVMFAYREEYYSLKKAEAEALTGIMEIILAKNRHGPTDTVYLRFQPEIMRITDVDLRTQEEILYAQSRNSDQD